MDYTHEITYLVRNEEDSSCISTLLRKIGAEIEHEDALKKIQLAYPIKKEAFAFLGVIRFRADASRMPELNENFCAEERIIRFLLTHPLQVQAEPGGEGRAREARPSGRGSAEGRRFSSAQTSPQTLSNEALQEKIEEILQ